MPVFTPTISQQNIGISSGNRTYPEMGQIFQNLVISDQFLRESLNPTNAIALYTTAVVGTGTATVSSKPLQLTTSNAVNDSVDVRLSNFIFGRGSFFIDSRSQYVMDLIFSTDVSGLTGTQAFIGFLINSSIALTTNPTTLVHAGISFDTSVSNNLQLDYSNGTTQTQVDTGINMTGAAANYRLNITVNSDTGGTMSLYTQGTNPNDFSTLAKTTTFNAGSQFARYGYDIQQLHFFVKTLTLNARKIRIQEYIVTAT